MKMGDPWADRWDSRGPCNGPRDCVGTERGCAACDPGGEPVTFKCKVCGVAGEARNQEQANERMAHHIENHRASGWEG